MKTVFFFNKVTQHTWKWMFSSVFMLCMLWSADSNAQLVAPRPLRDSSLSNIRQVTRVQILSMTAHQALEFLEAGGFAITDLINASYADFMNAAPDEYFMTPNEFYGLIPQKQYDAITDPTKYKIYKP